MNNLVRTEEELEVMRKSGKITAQVLKRVIEAVEPGVNLMELENIADSSLEELGAKASFKTVDGYKFATCLNVNEEVVHGLPRDIVLNDGDILKIDLGALYKGWHTDCAWTVVVGGVKDPQVKRFLSIGEEAMWKALKQAKHGNYTGDISEVIQNTIEGAGYNIVKNLTGHGVGREAHEAPEIPGFGKAGTGVKLNSGMTLAIEAIYTTGEDRTFVKEDNWTISGIEGSMAGLFEMTVIVGPLGPEVITDWRIL
jgi:methionyl aminopeptidase